MKNTLIQKPILLSMVCAFLLPTLSLQATYRDIDIMKGKKPELRVLASQLRDEIHYLRKENERLEKTIEPRSYQKGKNAGLIIGGASGLIGAAVIGFVTIYLKANSRRFR